MFLCLRLVLAFLLSSVALCEASKLRSAAPEKLITGNYTNEYGSGLAIWVDNELFSVHGFYCSAVGNAGGRYPIVGVYNTESSELSSSNTAIVSWCVAWANEQHGNSHSATCWSGHLINDVITASFHLAVPVSKPEDMWKGTLTGTDVFTKTSNRVC